jgi:hypothetical protein
MSLSEQEWDDAKSYGQYIHAQGDDTDDGVVAFRRADLASYLGMMGFCHIPPDDVQLDAINSAVATAWGWLWHVTTTDYRVRTARTILCSMLNSGLKTYGIKTAKDEGACCSFNTRTSHTANPNARSTNNV